MLTCDGFLPCFDIKQLGLAVDPLELKGFRINPFALHLTTHDRALESHDTEVMAVGSFHNDEVAGLYTLTGSIAIDSLAGILEADLIKAIVLLLINPCKPIIYLKLAAALPIGTLQFSGIHPLYHTSAGAVIFL
jgi:hypothetical protein